MPFAFKTTRGGLALLALLGATPHVATEAQSVGDSLPLHAFAYDRAAPIALRDSLRATDMHGVRVYSVSFASARGGRATGVLCVPTGDGPFAGILFQHGMPGNAEQTLTTAMHLARHGAAVLSLDAPWARRGGPPVAFTAQDSADQVQLITDMQRGVDVLIARRDVDPARLAYVGVSYGGAMGALLAGVERRLKTYILAVGDGGLVSHFTGADDPPNGPAGMPRERWQRWLAAMRPIEPLRFVARAAPASIFFQSGRHDRLVPPVDAAWVHRAASEPKTVKWYEAGHGLGPQARVDQLEWLSRTIGTRPPARGE
ncbi:MAG: alpha/beta hydrolase family protein [Gemmatimonadaceae bacterium]